MILFIKPLALDLSGDSLDLEALAGPWAESKIISIKFSPETPLPRSETESTGVEDP